MLRVPSLIVRIGNLGERNDSVQRRQQLHVSVCSVNRRVTDTYGEVRFQETAPGFIEGQRCAAGTEHAFEDRTTYPGQREDRKAGTGIVPTGLVTNHTAKMGLCGSHEHILPKVGGGQRHVVQKTPQRIARFEIGNHLHDVFPEVCLRRPLDRPVDPVAAAGRAEQACHQQH